jgi:hypothetical protein
LKHRNAWAIALFGVIAVFVVWKLLSGDAKKPRAAAAAPTTAETAPPPEPTFAPTTTVANADPPRPGRRTDIESVNAPSGWVTPSSMPPGKKMMVPDPGINDPDGHPEVAQRMLKFEQRRLSTLQQRLALAEKRGDSQQAAELRQKIDESEQRIERLRDVAGQ